MNPFTVFLLSALLLALHDGWQCVRGGAVALVQVGVIYQV
jgi:hypothetical protein